MTSNIHIWMLAVVFLAQLIVMSFIAPTRVRTAYRLIRERFPREQYPRLYPISAEEQQRWNHAIKRLHVLVGCAGFIVLIAALYSLERVWQFALVVSAVSLIQLLPTFFYSVWARRILKEAAKMTPPAKRSASLHASRITDYVSPLSIALGFVGTAIALATATYVYALDTRATPMIVFSTVISILLLLRMLQRVLRPLSFSRPDPYMSQQDLFRTRKQRLGVLFVVATFLNAFFVFAMLYAARVISFDLVYVVIGGSILMQALALRTSARIVRFLDSADFSVYREPNALPAGNRPSVA